jgi:hypothetical protein
MTETIAFRRNPTSKLKTVAASMASLVVFSAFYWAKEKVPWTYFPIVFVVCIPGIRSIWLAYRYKTLLTLSDEGLLYQKKFYAWSTIKLYKLHHYKMRPRDKHFVTALTLRIKKDMDDKYHWLTDITIPFPELEAHIGRFMEAHNIPRKD